MEVGIEEEGGKWHLEQVAAFGVGWGHTVDSCALGVEEHFALRVASHLVRDWGGGAVGAGERALFSIFTLNHRVNIGVKNNSKRPSMRSTASQLISSQSRGRVKY